ncbi:MAG: addiction module protein [Chthoniobacteraceae bacterium]
MSTALTANVDIVKDAALALPLSARAYLAEALLESLAHSDEELAAIPIGEDAVSLAEERLRAVREGRARTLPLEDAIARLSTGLPT